MTHLKFAALAVSFLGLALPAHADDIPKVLTPAEISSTFVTGLPFAATANTGKVIMITLKPDGTALAVPKGEKKGNKGKWRLSDKGYCTIWGKSPEHCYTVRLVSISYEVVNATGLVVAHWAK
jgi:hypothetical protein